MEPYNAVRNQIAHGALLSAYIDMVGDRRFLRDAVIAGVGLIE